MELKRAVFQAIANPTRREIIGLLATSAPLTLIGVSDNLETKRPAISKHVKILEECGLASIQKVGRTRACQKSLERINQNICMGRTQAQGLLQQTGYA